MKLSCTVSLNTIQTTWCLVQLDFFAACPPATQTQLEELMHVLQVFTLCSRGVAWETNCFISGSSSITYMPPIQAFATGIKAFDQQKVCLIVWLFPSRHLSAWFSMGQKSNCSRVFLMGHLVASSLAKPDILAMKLEWKVFLNMASYSLLKLLSRWSKDFQ